MREIKFRIWNNEEKVMIPNKDIYSIDFRGDIYFSSVRVDGFIFDSDDGYKLMQYTGIKDIEGNEIYEGDIVTSASTGPEVASFFKGVVKFYDGTFYIDNEETEIGIPLFDETNELKVIGNIYKQLKEEF